MDDVLIHYGKLGMKWGVRRLEAAKNVADAGKRYSEEYGKLYKTGHSIRRLKERPDYTKMSDADLKKIVDRMTLEQKFVNLHGNDIDKGHSYTKNIIEGAGAVLGVAGTVAGLALAIRQFKALKGG